MSQVVTCSASDWSQLHRLTGIFLKKISSTYLRTDTIHAFKHSLRAKGGTPFRPALSYKSPNTLTRSSPHTLKTSKLLGHSMKLKVEGEHLNIAHSLGLHCTSCYSRRTVAFPMNMTGYGTLPLTRKYNLKNLDFFSSDPFSKRKVSPLLLKSDYILTYFFKVTQWAKGQDHGFEPVSCTLSCYF